MAAMREASTEVTSPMRVIPPRITVITTPAVTSPVIQTGIPQTVWTLSATVLACTAFPVGKAVQASITAKNTVRGFHLDPRPRSL